MTVSTFITKEINNKYFLLCSIFLFLLRCFPPLLRAGKAVWGNLTLSARESVRVEPRAYTQIPGYTVPRYRVHSTQIPCVTKFMARFTRKIGENLQSQIKPIPIIKGKIKRQQQPLLACRLSGSQTPYFHLDLYPLRTEK